MSIGEIRQRGAETTLGDEGWCTGCGQLAPAGPDPCLGTLPGVAAACCGHGVTEAYVAFGSAPDANLELELDATDLRGADALAYFAIMRRRQRIQP